MSFVVVGVVGGALVKKRERTEDKEKNVKHVEERERKLQEKDEGVEILLSFWEKSNKGLNKKFSTDEIFTMQIEFSLKGKIQPIFFSGFQPLEVSSILSFAVFFRLRPFPKATNVSFFSKYFFRYFCLFACLSSSVPLVEFSMAMCFQLLLA